MAGLVGGIAGRVQFNGQPLADSDIESLVRSAPHRSSAGVRVYHFGNGVLLACMHEASRSDEPTVPQALSGLYFVVLHGAIHNASELESRLGKHFTPGACTPEELLVAAYRKWGERCPAYILGDYAFAIWNGSNRELFCARDAIGIKPLYYYADDNFFAFGSEIDQLVCHGPARQHLDEDYILAFAEDRTCDRESTFFRGVKRLPAAHSLVVSERGLRRFRYWDPKNLPILRLASLDDYVDAFSDLFLDAIRVRLPAQSQPLGALLSGGIDSASVVAGIQKIGHSCADDSQVLALSLGFQGLPCDESKMIGAVASGLGVDLHLHQHEAITGQAFRDRVQGSCSAPESVTAMAYGELFNHARRRGMRVVMGGWGADDWLGRHRGMYYDLLATGHLKQFTGLMARVRADGLGAVLTGIGTDLVRDPWVRQIKRMLLASGLPLFTQRGNYVEDFDVTGWYSVMKWRQYEWLNSALFAQNAEMQECSAARYGVDARYPYNDRRIVEFGLSLGPEVFASSAVSKPVVRGTLSRLAPQLANTAYLNPEGSAIYWQTLHDLSRRGDYQLDALRRFLDLPDSYGCELADAAAVPVFDESLHARLARRQSNSYGTSVWLENFFDSVD